MKKTLFLSWLFLCGLLAEGQDNKIHADRPGETLTPELTQKKFLQLEIGFEKEQQEKDEYSLFHPQMQIKYGLFKRIELRAELTAVSNKVANGNDQLQLGLQPVEFGIKANLLEQKGALPMTSFYTQVGVPPLATKEYQTTNAIPHLRLLFENKVNESFHLEYNIGAEWDGEETAPQWLYTIAPELYIGEKWEVFAEAFGSVQKAHAAQHNLDCGLAFYPTNSVKLDLFAGKGISKEAPEYFISAGVSFRFR